MSKKKSRLGVALLAALTTLALAGCGGAAGGSEASGSGSYELGAVFPLSGPSRLYGVRYRQAMSIALDFVNKNYHLKHKVKVDYEDGKALPSPSVTAMNKLVNTKHVPAVLTGFSAPTKAIAPIAKRDKVVEINGGGSSPELAQLNKYVFNTIPLANQQVPRAVSYAVGKLGLKRWVVLYSNETLGKSMLKAIKTDLPKAGGTVSGAIPVDSQATDFGPQVARIRSLRPDLVFLATTSGGQPPIMMRQMRAAGIKAQAMSYAGIDSPPLLKTPAAQGMLFTIQSIDFKADNAATNYFNKQFAAKYPGKTPTTLQVNYYDSVLVLGQAMKKLEKAGKDITGESLRQAIHNKKTFTVAGGKISINSNGTVTEPIAVVKVKNKDEATVAKPKK
jgi:ABC-type branched-subunit amino acid transport system substrate-binding protein